MKVVINKCFGGFGLSHKAIMRYAELAGITLYTYYDDIALKVYGPDRLHESGRRHYMTVPCDADEHGVVSKFPDEGYWSYYDMERTDPLLIQTVEELGQDADGQHAKLAVIEIPDGIDWEIDEYDGTEQIAEKHRTWC